MPHHPSAGQAARPALRIQNLVKTYPGGTEALKGVSLTVEAGEFFGLLGPNGAGKSTLISCLGGLARPTSGSIEIFGVNPARTPRLAARSVGIVPQEITFDPFLTVRETLRFQSGYWGIARNDEWIGEVLERLGLADKADASMRSLSGGMKRRVLVAQALVHKPPLIVLDEPTAGVDVELREALWNFIGALHAEGHTIILTTHYLEEAQALCGRVAILAHGRIEALERTDALLERFEGRILRCRIASGALPETLLGRVVRRHGGDVALHVEDAEDIAAVLNALLAAGVQVENLTVAQPSLEDVFLSITGERA